MSEWGQSETYVARLRFFFMSFMSKLVQYIQHRQMFLPIQLF